MRGVALGLYPGGRGDRARYRKAVDEIAAFGATHIALVVTWHQGDVRSVRIRRTKKTTPDALLEAMIAHAHKRKLRVLVFPILNLEITKPGQWRGTVAPRNRDTWWISYEDFILHYAKIAAKTKTWGLLIGSELGSTEGWRARWYHLISAVQRRYKGTLTYSANWDHFHNVSFWRRLPFIGVTGYFQLSKRDNASQRELTRAWTAARDRLVRYANKIGKPLWITEVGYQSRNGTAVRPWDYGARGAVDLEEQRRCWYAFKKAWAGNKSLGGMFVWDWHGPGGHRDRNYTPRNKPAGALLRSWFRGR